MRVSAADLASAAAVSAAVWAAVRVGAGSTAGEAFFYGIGFFVAGVMFLGVFGARGVRRARDE